MAQSRFGWGVPVGKPLEAKCLSEVQAERDECFGYIQSLLDHYFEFEKGDVYIPDNKATLRGFARAREDVQSGSITSLEIGCYFGDFLTLRDTSLHGYRHILDLVEWLDTTDGKVKSADAPEFAHITREFVEKIAPARDNIRELRQTGQVPWLCRLVRWTLGRN